MKHLWVYPLAGLLLLSACKPKQKQTWLSEETKATQATQAPAGALELVFPYGSEKEKWIKDVTESFNHSGRKLVNGKTIFVRAIPMGSGEVIDEILASWAVRGAYRVARLSRIRKARQCRIAIQVRQ
jgi:hypothetical protein